MSFYKVEKSFSSAWVNSNFYKIEDAKYYTKIISGDSVYDLDNPIYLELRNFDEETNLQNWKFGDYLQWKLGSAQASCMIVSPRLRELLSQKLILPKHKFYNTEIYNPKTGETRTDYSILHLTHNIYEEIDLNESIFGIFSLDDNKLKAELERGYIKSQNDLNIEINKQIELSGLIVKPIKIVLKPQYNYDIISIDLGSKFVYTRSRAKEIISENQITGIEFTENNPNDIWITGPEIINRYL